MLLFEGGDDPNETKPPLIYTVLVYFFFYFFAIPTFTAQLISLASSPCVVQHHHALNRKVDPVGIASYYIED